MYVKSQIEASSCNHCYSRKEKLLHILSCALVDLRMSHIMLPTVSLSCSTAFFHNIS